MIRSFRSGDTERLFHDEDVKRFRSIVLPARKKLELVDASISLDVLRVIPGNRLQKLKGDRKGQWSIWINDQWRICFRWDDGDAFDVEICDYH